jgi:hypothetical protein
VPFQVSRAPILRDSLTASQLVNCAGIRTFRTNARMTIGRSLARRLEELEAELVPPSDESVLTSYSRASARPSLCQH